MAETYALTPAVWPPLVASVFATVMALYCWHRREVPAAKPLLCVFAFGTLYALAGALGAAALTPATKMTWFKVGDAFALPAATAGTCFVLEYTYPGRWLTRRNLVLLALPPLVVAFLIFVNGGQFIWQAYVVGPSGLGAREAGAGGAVLTVYVLGLAVVNVTALLWLFTRSPQHRWPVALILAGQIASRAVFLAYVARQPWTPLVDPLIAVILIASVTYAVALFGFRIFDPMPAARQAVFQQLPAGGVVFDARGRVLSLNPAAQTILGIAESGARGKTWRELVPAGELLAEMLRRGEPVRQKSSPVGQSTHLPDIALGRGPHAREYAQMLSPLCDFRGLLLGYLLVLPDVTNLHRAQRLALEKQRVIAIQNERERMARELHDSLGQVLSYAGLQVETAAQLASEGRGEAAATHLERLGGVIREAHADLREDILNLHSTASLDRPFFSDVSQYLDGYTRSYGIRTLLEVDPALGEGTFPPEMKLQLLRILQEALSNARKHGRAHQVSVGFAAENDRMSMSVLDDGCGFEPQAGARSDGAHYGLDFMRSRAAELGGSLHVASEPGCGTRMTVQVPVNASPLRENGESL